MVKNILLALFMVFGLSLYAQNNINYADVKLETEDDFKAAEPLVIGAADYVLSNPITGENVDYNYAIQFVLAWMGGTPDYTFSLDSMDKLGGDVFLSSVYIASLAKYTLEHKSEATDDKLLRNGAWKLFLDYCNNPVNKVKKNKHLNKLLKAYSEKRLEAELDK